MTSILGMIAAAIFTTFSGGLNVYERVQAYGGTQADVLLFLEKIERELRNTFSISGIDFSGDSKRIAFAGLISELDFERNQNISLGKILYYFDGEKGIMVKEEQNYPQAISKSETRKSSSEILLSIENVDFSYYYFDLNKNEYEWKDSWNAGDGIPKGVKVKVTFRNGGRNVTLVRTVLIPVAG